MTFTDEELLPLVYRLDRLEAPRGLAVTVHDPGSAEPWTLEIALSPETGEGGAVTVVAVAQTVGNNAVAPSAAAGCEYYLDRLGAHVENREDARPDYDEYFLGQAAHYRRLFPVRRRRPA